MSVIPIPKNVQLGQCEYPKFESISLELGPFEHMNALIVQQFQNFLSVTVKETASARLSLIKDEKYEQEAYVLDIIDGQITISASGDSGIYYALQTLFQYLALDEPVKSVTIYDHPRFSHRGLMLDVSRHFMSIDTVKSLIETLSRLKFNRFHFHLTDDHGWRIALDQFPSLTQGTDQFYTKSDIQSIVDFANEHMITVIPEIDMPGHVLGLLTVMPELSCEPKSFTLADGPGISEEVLCLGNPDVFTIMASILDEVVSLFNATEVHIGGDEVPKTRWLSCKKCRDMAAKHDLISPNALQAHFLQKMIDQLNNQGVKVILWNDACMSVKFKGDVVTQFWMTTDKANGLIHLNQNYPIIDSNFKYYYFDYPIEMRSLENCYRYESIFEGIENSNLIGIESPVWTEWIDNRDVLDARIYPRLMAIAESAWSSPDQKNYPDFEKRLIKLRPWWQQSGVKIIDPRFWNYKGIKKAKHSIAHVARMLDLKTVHTAVKMQKQNKLTF